MGWTLASDIDGTLTGDRPALDALAVRISNARSSGDLQLILCTGRRYVDVLEGIAGEGLPEPDAIVAQVGTEVYLPPFDARATPLESWRDRVSVGYSPEEALAFFDGIEGLALQPDKYNTALKASCTLDEAPDPEAAAREIARRAARHADRYQVVWSGDRYLDVLPARAGKGKAVRFLAAWLGLEEARIIGAGDTGNDGSMLEELPYAIVVGNATRELLELASRLDHGRSYTAKLRHAAGIAEGLEHFGVLASNA